MYKIVTKIRKFTTKEEVDSIIGIPKFQIAQLPIYYYGEGTLVAYAPYQFKIENEKRIEYGEVGNYAVAVYHFADVNMLKDNFGISSFEAEDIKFSVDAIIDENVVYNQSYEEIQRMGLRRKYVGNYMEGETRRLIEGKLKVINLFIMYGACTLYFRGTSKKNKVSGFKYTL